MQFAYNIQYSVLTRSTAAHETRDAAWLEVSTHILQQVQLVAIFQLDSVADVLCVCRYVYIGVYVCVSVCISVL